MEKIFLLGCSFTYHVTQFSINLNEKLSYPTEIVNLGYISRSNFQILEDVKTLPNNSIVIIQWSALTRDNGIIDYEIDWNKDLNEMLENQSDPLRFLINNFINIVTESNEILKEKNIKVFQYIGWQQWADFEIDKELEDKLLTLNINWFKTPKLIDIIPYNCWHYNSKSYVQKIFDLLGHGKKWQWDSTNWGGMSEWIRLNVNDMEKRYINPNDNENFDSHPSEFATKFFYDEVIIPNINKILSDGEVQNN